MASEATKKKTGAGNKSAPSKKAGGTESSSSVKKKPEADNRSAASKKNTTAGSSRKTSKTAAVSTRRENTVPEPVYEERENPLLMKEAVLWLILAVCVLVFISYFGIGGYIGEVFSDICFGVFGISAYVFPVLLFLASAFVISNKGSRIAGIKLGSSILLYLCICSFASLFTGDYMEAGTAAGLYDRSAAYQSGGGVIGGLVCQLLQPAVGSVGTGIILGVFSIICFVLITQKSLMRGMRHQGEKVYQSAKESSARRREIHQQERQRRDDWRRFEEQTSAEESFNRPENIPRKEPVRVERVAPDRKRTVSRPKNGQNSGTPAFSGNNLEVYGTNGQSSAGTVRPSRSGRTEIEVPVIFPANRRDRRVDHRVTGITADTKLSGESFGNTAEIHEILPGTAVSSEKTSARPESSGTCYINLEEDRTEAVPESVKTLTVISEEKTEQTPEAFDFHIEGIEHPIPKKSTQSPEISLEEPAVSALKDEVPKDEVLEDDESEDKFFDEEEIPEEPTYTESEPKKKRRKIYTDDIFRSDSDQGAPSSAGTVFRSAAESSSDEESVPSKRNPRSSEKEIAAGIASVEAEMAKAAEAVKPEYVYPPIDLLKKGNTKGGNSGQEQEIRKTAAKLQQTLNSFGVHVTVTNVSCGPTVTRYELLPEQGVKVSRIVSLSDDIKLNLAAADIRIEAPIPGKAAVGIEVPNAENSAVALRDLIESDEFQNHKSKLAFAAGKDIGGKPVVTDIAKMPHLLIAGATGSGKSVCINTLIMSILYKAHPDEVKLIMIDPKVVELSVYNGIPHLFIPVVTDPKKAAGALNWAVAEMTDRYNKFAEVGVRDLKGYNQKIDALKDVEDENKPKKLPQIVIIVDELADLMMVAPGEVEDSICRLAQLARAAGIHLIIATQRPSVNVITGLIKANMPSRIAFSVSSGVDSRTILDMNGAEKLLGKGDMLFYPQGLQKPARVQGALVTDEEVSDVVDFLKNKNTDPTYNAEMEEQIAKVQQAVSAARNAEDTDALFADAGKFIIEKDKASIGMLQRVFKIGFNRAARIMDQLSDAGVVGPEEGTKPRKILMSAEQFENYLEENG